MNPRKRRLISWTIAYGPAAAWLVVAVVKLGPTRGYWPFLGLAAMVAFGIFGLSGVFLAWFPWAMDQIGAARFAAWLRTWWDEDAK
jgi:hypothetical protein